MLLLDVLVKTSYFQIACLMIAKKLFIFLVESLCMEAPEDES